MNSILLVLFAFTASLFLSTGEDEIDYYPKLLIKELNAVKGSENLIISELRPLSADKSIIMNEGKFFRARGADSLTFKVYVGRVFSCRAGGCSARSVSIPDIREEAFEYFDYFIIFSENNSIISVRIFNYEATHGHEIMVRGWLKQFIGYDGSGNLRPGKEIDSISGATISVDRLVEDIRNKTAIVKNLY